MSIKARFRSRTAKIGMWTLVLGTGPLLLIILLDTLRFPVSDNPIGLGLLFIATFPIGIILLVVGLIKGQ